ncbi:hypothetical protein NR798_05540 [Archangium gephyra]|uniref:hypothetical protein n=1 Tax=Archangium gephyra TaxID=48 RepID=UPI0035D4DE3B
MKKMFVLLAASITLTACGGTVESEEQSELQTTRQQIDGAENMHCESTCGCYAQSQGGNCGWKCVLNFDSPTSTYQYWNVTAACFNGSNTCSAAYSKLCSAPCIVGSYSTSPCS